MKLTPARPIPWLFAILALFVIGAALVYTNRWRISRRAVEIADPSVRAWASREVARLSDGSYVLNTTIIKVDEARRRVAIDTITLVTDSVANRRRGTPLPALSLRFRNCALEGIDLAQLTAGRGLHVSRMGCDSVALLVSVPPGLASDLPQRKGGPVDFLNITQKLNLPSNLPFIAVDSLRFPEVRLELSIAGTVGRRTNITFDRLGMGFDSLRYERNGNNANDRVLLSRDVRISLERFEGSREARNRVSLKLLSASLARGTLRLDSLVYAPLPGKFADSLGLKALEVGHLALDGVDWRRFLTTGDVRVQRLTLNDALVRLPYQRSTEKPAAVRVAQGGHSGAAKASPGGNHDAEAHTLEMVIRALGRRIQLDTLAATNLAFIDEGKTPRDNSTTKVERLAIRNLAVEDTDSSWAGAFPVGRVILEANGISYTGSNKWISLDFLGADLPASTIELKKFRDGPPGNDDDFLRRSRYREDRVSIQSSEVSLQGVDLRNLLHTGGYAVRRAAIEGFGIDILSDRRRPNRPGSSASHRYPQQVIRDLGLPVRIDTITVHGTLLYRERDSAATAPGVLSFNHVAATVTGFHTMAGSSTKDSLPMHLIADARLMGVGATHLDVILPLQAATFQMRFKGSVGGMRADSLNGFLGNAVGMRFTGGDIENIRFDAVVDKGHAIGQVVPRWKGLGVSLPGIARGKGGLLAGVRRAVAGFAANAFVIRADNTSPGVIKDGKIDQRWQPSETLPAFIWTSLRDALLPLLKK